MCFAKIVTSALGAGVSSSPRAALLLLLQAVAMISELPLRAREARAAFADGEEL